MSELVTNAVVHAQTPLQLCLHVRRDAVKVMVVDGSDDLPRLQDTGPLDVGGRGLRLIDAVSDRWGADPIPGAGKAVWCEIGARTA